MSCLLVWVAYGHFFIQGYGTWFYKACYYTCGSQTNQWANRVYRVHPNAYCPAELRET